MSPRGFLLVANRELSVQGMIDLIIMSHVDRCDSWAAFLLSFVAVLSDGGSGYREVKPGCSL